MNHFNSQLLLVFLMIFTQIVHSKEVKEQSSYGNEAEKRNIELVKPRYPDTVVKENTLKDITQILPGKWDIAPNKRASAGFIIFNQDGTYEMFEKLYDGTGVGKKGEYLLYSNVIPVRIDMCLDKCNNAGSEWTTVFGIIRVLSEEKLEIRSSADGTYPSGFSDDQSDEYTIILIRSE